MNVSVFQLDTKWMDTGVNLDAIETQCALLSGKTDLLVLPEMFSTGYTMVPGQIPLNSQELVVNALQHFSEKYQMTIAGTIAMFKDQAWYNTFVFINATGIIHQYDKVHLFTLAGESDAYAPGDLNLTFDLDLWKVQPLICYDLRFPYLSFTKDRPDLLIYSANWPKARIQHWRSLLMARAIENQCYVIGVNRVGIDENGFTYVGASMFVDFNGEVIQELGDKPESMTAWLDKEEMYHFRGKLPFYNDRKIL